MRVAWFSPLPPVHSGIAAYSLDVLEGLRLTHQVDLYADDGVWHAAGGGLHAGRGPDTAPLAGPLVLPLFRAYDFAVAHERAPYDLVVYQMGNAACHRFMWPYMLRWPGLVVLHDAALHHARAQALLLDKRPDDYRAEFRFNHPGVDPRVADFVVAGLEGSPYYLWPMLRLVMSRARAVAVHGEPLRDALAEEFPGTPVVAIAMGVPDPWNRVMPNAECQMLNDGGTGTGAWLNAERRTPNAEGSATGASASGSRGPLATPDSPLPTPDIEPNAEGASGPGEQPLPNPQSRVPRPDPEPKADGRPTKAGGAETEANAERRTPNADGAATGDRHSATGAPASGYRVPGAGHGREPATPDSPLPTPEPLSTPDGRPTKAGVVALSAFGLITPEKRIRPILQALSEIRAEASHVRLRLVGEIGEHYALWQDVAATGTRDLIEVTGYVDDDALAAELRRADICLCLRWPTAHETSASWLRCLAAGKPTIVPDQLTTVEVPTLDPRHWLLKHVRDDAAAVFQPPDSTQAVAVSVELGDEAAMLRQALRRLVADADLRASLSRRAREWWEAHHTVARMQRDYVRVLEWAARQPLPDWPADAPPHLRPDPAALARHLAAPFGVEVDILR